jgi:hypothetical protein
MLKSVPLCIAILFCLGQSLLLCCLADSNTPDTEPNYHWGRGLSVPKANLNIGGYLDLSFEQLNQNHKITLDDLSLFMSWSPHDRLQFFSEIELEEWLASDEATNFSAALKIERLYADLLVTDSFKVRLGKFLTPFGRWNLIHAAPLVWTTSRPLATDKQLFPTHVSGLMLTKSFVLNEQNMDISVYADDSPVFDPREDEVDFDHAVGGRVNIEIFEQLQIGASYLAFKNRAKARLETNHLWGLDMLWKKNDYELQMEFSYRTAGDSQGHKTSFYLQGVAPLDFHLFAIGRYEYLDGKQEVDAKPIKDHAQLGIVGLAWRPYPPLVFKAEYRFGSQNQDIAPSGFFTSIAMFF